MAQVPCGVQGRRHVRVLDPDRRAAACLQGLGRGDSRSQARTWREHRPGLVSIKRGASRQGCRHLRVAGQPRGDTLQRRRYASRRLGHGQRALLPHRGRQAHGTDDTPAAADTLQHRRENTVQHLMERREDRVERHLVRTDNRLQRQ